MSYGEMGRAVHYALQLRTERDLETFNMQWVLHRLRGRAEGFAPLNKRQFVGVLLNIRKHH